MSFWATKNYRESYNMYACNGILFNRESPRRGEIFVTRKISLAAAAISLGKLDVLTLGCDARAASPGTVWLLTGAGANGQEHGRKARLGPRSRLCGGDVGNFTAGMRRGSCRRTTHCVHTHSN